MVIAESFTEGAASVSHRDWKSSCLTVTDASGDACVKPSVSCQGSSPLPSSPSQITSVPRPITSMLNIPAQVVPVRTFTEQVNESLSPALEQLAESKPGLGVMLTPSDCSKSSPLSTLIEIVPVQLVFLL